MVLIDDVADEAVPARKLTVVVVVKFGVLIEIVLTSAIEDLMVQVEIPLESVAEHALTVFPVPVALMIGVTELIKFELASLRVIVMVARSALFAV